MDGPPGRHPSVVPALRLRLAGGPLVLLLAAALVVACGTKEAEREATASPPPAATATATSEPSIDEVDFSQVPAVEDLLASTGGRLLPQEVVLTDLTGDGAPEAVVPINSGGSGGDIAYAVFSYRDGDLEEILSVKPEAGRVSLSVQDGMLVDTQPVYAPEDPLCCPSQLRHTFYRWDGSELAVDHLETEETPSAKP